MKLKLLSSAVVFSLFVVQAYAMTEKKVYQYEYDSNGNAIAIKQVINNTSQSLYEYSYNDLNQMVSFEDVVNHKSINYIYYPNGKRLAKHGYSELVQEAIVFYYGHHGQLMNESYSKNNQTIKQSSYFAGLRFIDDLFNSNDSHLQYPIADQHNHPATINFGQDDTTIESYQLTDYGQLEQSNTRQAETKMGKSNLFNFEINPKIYGSGYYDSESNLQYMGARYYSANTQRFMAQDSYDLLNRYNYANANPVMNYDPDGHFTISDLLPHSAGGWIGLSLGFTVGVGLGISTGGADKTVAMALVSEVLISMALTAAGDVINQGIYNSGLDHLNWGEIGIDSAFGAAVGIFGFGLGKGISSFSVDVEAVESLHTEFSDNIPQLQNNCGLVACSIMAKKNNLDLSSYRDVNPWSKDMLTADKIAQRFERLNINQEKNLFQNGRFFNKKDPLSGDSSVMQRPSIGDKGLVNTGNHWQYFEMRADNTLMLDRYLNPKGKLVENNKFLEYPEFYYWKQDEINVWPKSYTSKDDKKYQEEFITTQARNIFLNSEEVK